ncbi:MULTISPECIES: hypothetical protein [Lactococcus]|uniref:hypothetical protein n=1 Tax=Lactococcus TaxID=1357 RepID=UPI000230EA09|nr:MULTISPECIES: hypothetical protein [Lactococcus]EHE91723.1 hypothetical protein LLCRE1631_02565 [Lactococcus lactis subsp. lactis CNCM I-1631]MCT4407673.1 hypothetical protein [Lactococcus cremoris]UPG97670.1 hypothetical protein MXM90_10885 [Lactococcus lactis]GEB09716.1 hypothetical protein LLA03_23010 [Lactococcus lactis subsp. lactis]
MVLIDKKIKFLNQRIEEFNYNTYYMNEVEKNIIGVKGIYQKSEGTAKDDNTTESVEQKVEVTTSSARAVKKDNQFLFLVQIRLFDEKVVDKAILREFNLRMAFEVEVEVDNEQTMKKIDMISLEKALDIIKEFSKNDNGFPNVSITLEQLIAS